MMINTSLTDFIGQVRGDRALKVRGGALPFIDQAANGPRDIGQLARANKYQRDKSEQQEFGKP